MKFFRIKPVRVFTLCLIILFIAQVSLSVFPSLKTFAQQTPPDLTDPSTNPDLTGINSIPDLTGIQEQIALTVTPQNPKPGETVNARVEAAGIDLNQATISWYVNGGLKLSKTGANTFSIQAGPFGKSITILVRVTPSNGALPTEKSVTLSSQDVDIIWEAASYTPPFYKGKPLYGQEGNVKIVAVPNIINKSGQRVNPANLVYKWSLDYSIVGDKSGYGKNTFIYSGSILAQESFIQVEVTAADGTTGEGAILLAPRTPITLLYENDPLYGVMFNQSITNQFKLKSKEIRIDVYPYFFSTTGKTAYNLSYAWALNGFAIPVPSQKNSVVFRNANNVSGSSIISVTTDNSTHLLQHASNEVTLNF